MLVTTEDTELTVPAEVTISVSVPAPPVRLSPA
ncbi:MAG: hypothetical protein AW09_001470 [Candidatus Accumulibacter phosphatis]|uniref:Uncharacterized protein n=1 Tax=Candidatus Accumulibacter phosphatis TaxID=327160 RepID=A0A080LWV0_9PROT|nr:MAG: hypothetical protein AW09_001470 [Candidatus Accumulibacter phosphatis]